MLRRYLLVIITFSLLAATAGAAEAKYKYYRVGNAADAQTKTQAGFALMGGGDDSDEAFRWMCLKANGGDFLVIRASGKDDYNPYLEKLCKLNSVAALVIPNREAAQEPFVAETIRKAEALFIAGGDQANYIRGWTGTPVQEAVNELIGRGVPVGGTSAGLAVMGQFAFSALNDSAYSKETLADPYNDRVTIAKDFLDIVQMKNVITDTHFAKRDRLGRLLGFMARVVKDGMSDEVRGIGVDEKSVALLEPDGKVRVVGRGKGAYFFRPTKAPEVCEKGKALTYRGIEVVRVAPGGTFDLKAWKGEGKTYKLNVVDGKVESTQESGSAY